MSEFMLTRLKIKLSMLGEYYGVNAACCAVNESCKHNQIHLPLALYAPHPVPKAILHLCFPLPQWFLFIVGDIFSFQAAQRELCHVGEEHSPPNIRPRIKQFHE